MLELAASTHRSCDHRGTSHWGEDAACLIPFTGHASMRHAGADAHDGSLLSQYLWDPWPVLDGNGDVADVGGQQWWIVLATARAIPPEARHDHARLRLLRRDDAGWHDLGHLFPDGATRGSREWSGTAVFDPAASQLQVLYTAAGTRGEERPSYRQRLFAATASVVEGRIATWSQHRELLTAAPPYLPADELDAAPGLCRAFRDPFCFLDPADGAEYLVFAASVHDPGQAHAGAIGIARRRGDAWDLEPPLLAACGVNRELERPHLLVRQGRYYLFFSSHAQSFRPALPGRTGLYGFSADSMQGPWQPLNGSGLVLGNPASAPHAEYAWQVLNDGSIVSFSNYPDAGPGPVDPQACFAGAIAPMVQLQLNGMRTCVTPAAEEARR